MKPDQPAFAPPADADARRRKAKGGSGHLNDVGGQIPSDCMNAAPQTVPGAV